MGTQVESTCRRVYTAYYASPDIGFGQKVPRGTLEAKPGGIAKNLTQTTPWPSPCRSFERHMHANDAITEKGHLLRMKWMRWMVLALQMHHKTK